MPPSATACEEGRMLEPIFALVVALLLGGYLLLSIVRPEKF
ncbi:K+-transporting ATPase, KdpF subunit [Rhizobiales bacterium GAS113]|nr:K+-transporting ATPase, KdpF subunit [Rhizobiales bacterium GAS113]